MWPPLPLLPTCNNHNRAVVPVVALKSYSPPVLNPFIPPSFTLLLLRFPSQLLSSHPLCPTSFEVWPTTPSASSSAMHRDVPEQRAKSDCSKRSLDFVKQCPICIGGMPAYRAGSNRFKGPGFQRFPCIYACVYLPEMSPTASGKNGVDQTTGSAPSRSLVLS